MEDRTQVAPKMLESYELLDGFSIKLTFRYASDFRNMIEAIEAAYEDKDATIPDSEETATDGDSAMNGEPEWSVVHEIHPMNIGVASARYPSVLASPAPDTSYPDPIDAIREGFKTHKDWGLENVAIIPDVGGVVIQVLYPEGTSAPSDNGKGGAGFYAEYPKLVGSRSAVLRYEVFFPDGFDHVKGGKLPGLYCGNAPSGGMSPEDGATTRMMWRADGQGELYLYIINKDNPYGQSIGRGMFNWPTGRWASIEQEIVLNDPGAANGIARVWIDDEPVFEVVDVVYRNRSEVTIDGLMFSTFFGGSSAEWRTPRDQIIRFRNFVIKGAR